MSWSLDARRPKPGVNPEGWYKFWMEELEWSFSRPDERLFPDSEAGNWSGSEDSLAHLHSLRDQHAAHRQQISKLSLSVYSRGRPVEKVWGEKGLQEREKILLKALVQVTMQPGAEDYWQYCPDVSKESLCSGKGEGLITLLKHFSLKNVEAKPSLDFPVLVEPRVWRLYDISEDKAKEAARPEGVRAVHEMFLICRHYFLSTVVLNVLTILYDIPVKMSYLKLGKEDKTRRKATKDVNPLPDYVYAAMNKAEKAHKVMGKILPLMDQCKNCSKMRKSTASYIHVEEVSSKRMMCCAGCKKIGRHITYCSRECQIQDYKHGNPPHKLTCSKSLKDFKPPEPAVEPDPFPLYTSNPSSALLLQLYFLRRDGSKYDYHLIRNDGRPLGIVVPTPGEKKIFLEARGMVMEKQDKASIGIMAYMFPNVTEQLANEYEVDIDKCTAEAAKGSTDFNQLTRFITSNLSGFAQ